MKVKSKDADKHADPEEGEDKRRIHNDEDELPRQLEAFVDGRNMTILMTLLTVFALWGDDIRLASCPKWSDPIFFAGFLFALIMFFLEFLINTVVKVDYKWSFFFWLDLVAAISIAPDIQWITDLLQMATSAGEQEASGEGAMNAMSGGKTARIVRLVRLIRLIRIVKLYSMVRKAKDADGEEKLKAQARAAANAKQAALKRVEASRLGKVLSEMTTRRVVIGVLLMLFILPNLTYEAVDYSKLWGLSQLLWLGRSDCENARAGANPESLAFHCDHQKDPVWATTDGWRNMIYMYTQVHQDTTRAIGANQKLLWLHIPDFEDNSKIQDIKSVTSVLGDWEMHPQCGGLNYDDSECPYRNTEMELVVYSPWECSDTADVMLPCSEIRIYARFERTQTVRDEAVKNIIKTLFVCLLLGTMAVQFQNDTQELVIAPIEKMVNIIKQLAEDPLRKPDLANFDSGEVHLKKKKKNQGPQLETAMLENTILKIGGLLQVGFGEAGAEIIGKNMSSGDGELNIMMPGIRMHAIFGYVNIHQFSATTECLQEDVMVFVNKIGEILHTCAHRWSGVANKNLGSSFLLLWKMPEQPTNENQRTNSQGDVAMLSANLADRALLSQVKFLAEVSRSEDLKAYSMDARIIEKFDKNYEVQFGLSLHVGWAIEGPIGSDFKVDASYLSPHINLCMSLEPLTEVYGVSLLMSENFYTLLSLRIKERIRKIDAVKFNGKTSGLFSYMICGKPPAAPENHTRGEILKAEGLDVTAGAIEADGAEFLFLVDQDVVQMQSGISEQLVSSARNGLCEYIAGNWSEARKCFEQALTYGDDGPSKAILEFMARYDYEAPSDWDGVHELPRISA